jgi:hypothetical protein
VCNVAWIASHVHHSEGDVANEGKVDVMEGLPNVSWGDVANVGDGDVANEFGIRVTLQT